MEHSQQYITTVTLGEIVYGAHRSSRPSYYLQRLRDLVLTQVTLLPFDEDAAYRYGTVRAQLEPAGMPLPEPDLQIAAVALARGLILVTGNTRHMQRVPGLVVENWLLPPEG